MPMDLSNCLVVGVSSRTLFDLKKENTIFEEKGLQAYSQYQREHEDDILEPGSGFHLIKGLLTLNNHFTDRRVVEVIVMSRNSADTGLRLFKSIQTHNLDITRAAFTNGASLVPYLSAFQIDLYLSRNEKDVQAAVNAGIAGAVIYDPPENFNPDTDKIRVAFDGDAVLFNSHDSERIYVEQGAEAFDAHERDLADIPLAEGPFSKLLKTLSLLQSSDINPEDPPVRIALVTARGNPAHERVIRTFRAWDVNVDEAFFLGGWPKEAVLKAFRAHIFFDDREANIVSASRVVPSARVPARLEPPTDEEKTDKSAGKPKPKKARRRKSTSKNSNT